MCDLLDYFFILVAGPRQLTLPSLSKGKPPLPDRMLRGWECSDAEMLSILTKGNRNSYLNIFRKYTLTHILSFAFFQIRYNVLAKGPSE